MVRRPIVLILLLLSSVALPMMMFGTAPRVGANPDAIIVALYNSPDNTGATFFCDGSHDENEIMAAENAAGADGTVIILAGNAVIENLIQIYDNNMTITGSGAGNTFLNREEVRN